MEESTQAAVVAALMDSALHGVSDPVEHHETHISHVFIAGERAYKLKKAVVLPFLDYGTLERRRYFCHEEIRLNRPLAPDVYVGVRAIARGESGLALAAEDDPGAVEYVVEMRRFYEDDTLAAHVRGGRADARLLHRVGVHLAAFHAAAPAGARAPALAARVSEDIRQLEEALAKAEEAVLGIATASARAFLERSAAVLDARARRGLVREGHGDLRLEHVLIGERLQFVDCVEFDPALRTADVAYDLAFGLMELHDLDAPALADALVEGYRNADGDPGDDRLLAGLAGCRALVRAKVAAVRTPRRTGERERFTTLARRLFWRGRGPLTVIVCGPAATGKTTLARELADASGFPHVSSDLVRKERAGAAATARLGREEYADTASRAVYEELGRRARTALEAGTGAIVDATFRRVADRAAFDTAVADAPGTTVVLRLDVPTAVARARAERRTADPTRVSDAGPELATAQTSEFEPFDAPWSARAVTVDADRPVGSLAQRAEAALDAKLRELSVAS